MKRKFFLSVFIPTVYIVITSSGGGSTPAWQKENVSFPMMDLEINATMKEHDRQKEMRQNQTLNAGIETCLLYTSPSPRDQRGSRMPSSA